MRSYRILLIDDDVELCESLTGFLTAAAHEVRFALDAAAGLRELAEPFDILLLDWNLPDIPGTEICKRFRDAGGTAPIIFITGRNDIIDKEEALELGADDYLCKPFDVRELVSRMDAVKRRPRVLAKTKLHLGDLEFDAELAAVSIGAKRAKLTALECHIISLLLQNQGTLLSTARIAGSMAEEVSEDSIRQAMLRLRHKLAVVGAGDIIETIPRGGYIVRPAANPQS